MDVGAGDVSSPFLFRFGLRIHAAASVLCAGRYFARAHAQTHTHAHARLQDIRDAVDFLHRSGRLHKAMMEAPAHFFEPNPQLGLFLSRLQEAKKTTFLLTNSPYGFVDAGMKFMLKDYLRAHKIQGEDRHEEGASGGRRASG